MSRSDKWRIKQFNRHRGPEELVTTIEEMENRVEEIFKSEGKTYIYESPDGGKTIHRREFGEYDNRELISNDKDV